MSSDVRSVPGLTTRDGVLEAVTLASRPANGVLGLEAVVLGLGLAK